MDKRFIKPNCGRFAAPFVCVLIGWTFGLTSVHAQDTHDWTDPAGGTWGTFTKWTPIGIPSSIDTANFDLVTTDPVVISLIQNRAVDEILITEGEFSFQGSGITPGDRTLSTDNSQIRASGHLILQENAGPGTPRHLTLAVDNQLEIAGQMSVRGGSLVTSDRSIIDDPENAFVQITGQDADGLPSRWEAGSLTVGMDEKGRIEVGPGAVLVSDSAAIAESATAGTSFFDAVINVFGRATDGSPATWNNAGLMEVGRQGAAVLSITDGALVTTGSAVIGPSSDVRVQELAAHWDIGTSLQVNDGDLLIERSGSVTSHDVEITLGGDVQVRQIGQDGVPATLTTTGTLQIGDTFRGELIVDQGARVFSESTEIGLDPTSLASSRVVLFGGAQPETTDWINTGDVYVGGSKDASVGLGEITVADNTVAEIGGKLKIWSGGDVEMTGGSLTVDVIDHANGGVFDFQGGTLQVNQFDGNLLNQGGTLAPGPDAGATTITGTFTQQSDGALALEIGGTAPGATHDLVSVAGQATLDGLLQLTLIDGFTPESSDVFTMLGAGSILGLFDNVTTSQRLATTDGGGSFAVHYGLGSAFDEDRIILSDFIANSLLAGDYNGDGFVSQGDLDLVLLNWGDGVLPSGFVTASIPGGGGFDGLISQNELDGVLLNWGDGTPPNITAVPEPSSAMLLVIGGIAIIRSTRSGFRDSWGSVSASVSRTRRPLRRFGLYGPVGVITFGISLVAQGQSALWQNPSGGFYETPSNWIPSAVPGPTNHIVFGQPGEYDIGFLSDHTAAGLTVSNNIKIGFTRGGVGSPDRRLTITGDALIQSAGLTLEGDPNGGGFDLDIAGEFSLVDNFSASAIALLTLANNARVTSGTAKINSENGIVYVQGEHAAWTIDGNLNLANSTTSDVQVINGGQIAVTGDTTLGGLSAATTGSGVFSIGTGASGVLPASFSTERNTIIGNHGDGLVSINAGGLVESGNRTQVAFGPNSDGFVNVFGIDSFGNRATWNPGLLTLGLGGVATVVIEDGALVNSGNTVVSQSSSASVDVVGAEWNIDGTLRIGQNVLGRLDLSDGGRLTSGTTTLGGTSAANSNGQLFITGGLPTDPTTVWENSGDFYVGGTEDQGLGQGNFVIAGDTRAEIAGTVRIWSEGRVNISLDATFSADTIDHTRGGAFEFEGGTLHVNRFEGDLLNPNGTLAPGVTGEIGLTTIFGNYTQHSDAALASQIGGTSAGATNDLVNITEDANIDGLLELSLFGGFTPSATDVFTILAADNLFGVFDNVSPGQRLITTDGLGSFVVNYGIGSAFDEDRIILSDFIANSLLAGDYNGDGFVSQADLDLVLLNWGDGVLPSGFIVASIPGGGPFDGLISQNELDGVLLNWGGGTPPSFRAVPEPATATLLALGLGAMCRRRVNSARRATA